MPAGGAGHGAPMVANGADQQALLRVADDDRGTGIATLEHRFARVEAEAALLVGGVTVETRLNEQRPDLRLEELDL
jgi:hypothetical protein